ncbi:MAG TPA: hypothetical protein VLH56_07700 [Dissulfurispiraceae bacterium]|nr:hypothetical protein [Dissulfurispiraceae bacterium]
MGFALARQWCGEKEAAEFDEIRALREEIRRLEGLVEDTARWLDHNRHPVKAGMLREELCRRGGVGSEK